MGIVKIPDDLHDELRKASAVMSRSINMQAEFWIRIGMLAELHPHLTFQQIVSDLLHAADVSGAQAAAASNGKDVAHGDH